MFVSIDRLKLKFAEQENTPNDTTATEDTESRVVNNPELVQEINEERNDSIRVDESIMISEEISRSSKPESPPANSNCCDCCKNEILSLKREIEELRMTINSNFRAETRIQKNNDALIKAIEALTSSRLDRSDSATHPPSSVSDQKKDKNKKQPRAEPRTAAANSTPRSTIPKAKNNRNQNGCNDAVESPSTVAVIGDSITKSIIGSKLAADRKVKSYSFPGATIEDIGDHIKPVLRRKPKYIIVHIGTNNLRADKPKTIKKKMVSLISDIKQHDKNVKSPCPQLHIETIDTKTLPSSSE